MPQTYDSKIAELTSGMDDIRRFLGSLSENQREVFPEIIERLQNTLEELHVAHEELRRQNEELAHAQTQLHHERERYRELFDQAPDGYIVTDMEGVVRDANQAAHELLHVVSPYLRGKPIVLFFDPAARSTVMQRMREFDGLTSMLETSEFEARLSPRNGEVIHVSIRAACFEKAGARRSIRWMIRDVSERHRVQSLLRNTNAELEARVAQRTQELDAACQRASKANQTKDRFLAALSHELRTPLAPVLATVMLLQRDESLPEPAREQLSAVRQSIELEARLIDDLLDISRIAAGKLILNREPIDLHRLIKKSVEMCMLPNLDATKIILSLHLDADHHTVRADAARLSQVFNNILQNALKFTAATGKIDIATANIPSFDHQPPRISISFADDGVGIALDTLPTLFNVFEQGGAQVTRRYGGLGLGMAISKAILDLHGGTIRAASPGLGKGATFTVELLSCESSLLHSDATPDPSLWNGKPIIQNQSKRLLLVEDHTLSIRVLKNLLEKMGFLVIPATSVAEAKAAAYAAPFDLIVSDIGLPDGTGIELMRDLHSRHKTPGICLSGYGTDHDLAESRDAGFSHHLVKPINIDQLANVLREIITH